MSTVIAGDVTYLEVSAVLNILDGGGTRRPVRYAILSTVSFACVCPEPVLVIGFLVIVFHQETERSHLCGVVGGLCHFRLADELLLAVHRHCGGPTGGTLVVVCTGRDSM